MGCTPTSSPACTRRLTPSPPIPTPTSMPSTPGIPPWAPPRAATSPRGRSPGTTTPSTRTRICGGSTYNANNGYDPDPAVGIYVPNAQFPTHWIGYRTDIEPDTKLGVTVDFALDENFNVMLHP